MIVFPSKTYIEKEIYRFGDCFLRRALPPVPIFLDSFIRGSRVNKPAFFKASLYVGSSFTNARAIPWDTASACERMPEPSTFTVTYTAHTRFTVVNGFANVTPCGSTELKYSFSGFPFTIDCPLPRYKRTRAVATLRRPMATIYSPFGAGGFATTTPPTAVTPFLFTFIGTDFLMFCNAIHSFFVLLYFFEFVFVCVFIQTKYVHSAQ